MNRNSIIADFLDQAVQDQSWYRKNANTINGTLAAIAATLVFLLTYVQATGTFEWAEATLAAIVPLATAIALKFTKNGVGPGQADELKRKAKDEADTPSGPMQVEETTPAPAPSPTPKPPAEHTTLDKLRDLVAKNVG